jgi:hypothetical protein
MAVRALTKTGDWTFGQSNANYLTGALEVRQNVITRIKSFRNDWFLDMEAGIDWMNLLANKNTKQIIEDEVSRITLTTPGVRTIEKLTLLEVKKNRSATILLGFTTIYNKSFLEQIGVPLK